MLPRPSLHQMFTTLKLKLKLHATIPQKIPEFAFSASQGLRIEVSRELQNPVAVWVLSHSLTLQTSDCDSNLCLRAIINSSMS